MAVPWYIRDNAPTSTVGWSAVTPWAALTIYAAGVLRRQLATPTVGNERVFVCIIAGTSLASEPSWTVTKGAKTAEAAGPTWQELTGQPGPNGDFTNCPTWLAVKNTAPGLGRVIQNNAGTHLFIVSTAGTAGNGAEPSFGTTAGNTTADNTVTWTCIGAVGSFGSWAAPHARLQNAYASTWGAAGDSFFVGDDHAQTQTGDFTLTSPGSYPSSFCFTYCVDHTAALPPTSADVNTGATVTSTTGRISLNDGGIYCEGLKFIVGDGTSQASARFIFNNGNTQYARWSNCTFQSTSTATLGSSAYVFQGGGSGLSGAEFYGCTFIFGVVGDNMSPQLMNLLFRNCSFAPSGSVPTTLFTGRGVAGTITCEGCDFGTFGSGKTLSSATDDEIYLSFIDCKYGASVTVSAAPSGPWGRKVDSIRSNSSGVGYRAERYWWHGTLTTETTIVRTGGFVDHVTAIASKIATTANAKWITPFESFPVSIWNSTTAGNVVVTMYGVWNAAALPNNDDLWIDVQYLGAAGSPMSSVKTSGKANNLVTAGALTADSSSAWDSVVTARANTTGYSLGDVRKVASNPGRIFFCTTAGTSSGSEPGGYASAVDGGSVTDGSAVFRAAIRFSTAVTLTSPQPQLAGYLRAYVRAGKVSSTFYVDPLPVLS